MKQARAQTLMADASPDTLMGLTPTTLVFHWKAAALHTTLLGAAVVWLFFALQGHPVAFTPDHLQAYIRAACIVPFLGFCFSAISVHRLIPRGITFGAVLLGTALALWTDFAAASLYYGTISGIGLEWIRTSLMILTTLAVVIIAVSNADYGYRTNQRELAAAERDVLTGLLNRAGLLRWYTQLDAGRTCTLVVFDLNGLKLINDTSGHGAGDAHISSIGQAIRTALTGVGRVGRWGGDEFVAILPDLSEEEVVKAVDTLLRQTSSESSLPAFAYGLSTLNTGETLERPFALADQRMYEAKELQRDSRTQHSREINAVEEVSRELEVLRTSEDLLTLGLPLIANLLRFDGTFYMQRSADMWMVTNLQVSSGQPLLFANGHIQTVNEGLIGRAYRTGAALWSTDYASEPGASEVWIASGLKTLLISPVRCLGEIVGFVYLCNFTTWRSITPQVRRMTDTLALRLGHVLDLERVEQNVRTTLEGGLLGLGAALEARDLETGGHTQRVVEHASHLGQALDLPPDQLEDLRQGAYLHDIGKLVIPDAILLKPGKLDAEEWAIMKTHAYEGGRIAARIPTLTKGAVDVICHHHERWDGNGYPDALSGTDIPLVARIFSVVDVYDALTSERPYKKAWTHEEAALEIEHQAGKQFDPEAVQVFLSSMSDRTLRVQPVLVHEVVG